MYVHPRGLLSLRIVVVRALSGYIEVDTFLIRYLATHVWTACVVY